MHGTIKLENNNSTTPNKTASTAYILAVARILFAGNKLIHVQDLRRSAQRRIESAGKHQGAGKLAPRS